MKFRAIVIMTLIALSLVCGTACAREGAKDEQAAVKLLNVTNSAELVEALKQAGRGGYTVNLAPGAYVLSETVEFSGVHHVNIVGSGWNTTISKPNGGDVFVFTNCGFCTVRNLLIHGNQNADSGSGIVFRGKSSSCTVDYCRISNFPQSGIRFEGVRETPQSTNTVSNCHFIGNLQDQLYSHHNNDFFIVGNQFGTHGGVPKVGCRLDHSSAGTYTMNYHWGNVNAMILGPGAHYNRIENNRFEESKETGVILGDPKGRDGNCFNIITGNTFHTNSQGDSGKYPAVDAYDSAEITFCQNQIFSWDSATYKHKSSLIIGRNCRNWIVKDNIFRHNTQKALEYEEGAGHIIKDNFTD